MRIEDARVYGFLERVYASLCPDDSAAAGPADRELIVLPCEQEPAPGLVQVALAGVSEPSPAVGKGQLVAQIDDVVVVELQKLRPELLFLHAAVVYREDRALLIVGRSGAGKSTLTLGLAQRGLGYSSDELGPVDLDSWQVYAFPRAIALKTEPPEPVVLPDAALVVEAGALIVPDLLRVSRRSDDEPLALAAVVVLSENRGARPELRGLSRAETVTALYPHLLNSLAHDGDGLDPLLHLSRRTPCWSLRAGSLGPTLDCIERLARHQLGA